MPSQVRIRIKSLSNSAKVARMLKNIFPNGIGRIVDRRPERQPDPAFEQPVELRHNERVAGAHRCQRLVETGPGTGAARKAAVGVDPQRVHAEVNESCALRLEVLRLFTLTADQFRGVSSGVMVH